MEGTATLSFSYGADRSRLKQVNSSTGVTTLYIDGLFEKRTAGTTTTQVHYIYALGRAVAAYTASGTTGTTRYLHDDHQGSVVLVTDEDGDVEGNRYSFDAFGRRRNATTWADTLTALSNSDTTRGYTGHESLDTVDLVHMNGRVYDPHLGRMLSADPYVQAPFEPQNLNRYSYVLNNPLSLVDPTGFNYQSGSGVYQFIAVTTEDGVGVMAVRTEGCGTICRTNRALERIFLGSGSSESGFGGGSGGSRNSQGDGADANNESQDNVARNDMGQVATTENNQQVTGNPYIQGRASFINVGIDFVQPGLKVFRFTLIPETNLVFDIGLVKLDTDGNLLSRNPFKLFYTRNTGNMLGVDFGINIEAGNAKAASFFGEAYEVNVGYLGHGTIRLKTGVSTGNPGGFFNWLSNHAFSFDVGYGGGVHMGEVSTRALWDEE